jgi:hypothetical protein
VEGRRHVRILGGRIGQNTSVPEAREPVTCHATRAARW